MAAYLRYILTTSLQQFLTMLTSIGMAAVSGLIILELVHKSRSALFWQLVYPLTALNVILWSFVFS